MTRRKVKLAYIAKASARRACFSKRKKCLIKKVSEVNTLCGIDTCVVIGPYEDHAIELWPDQAGVQQLISRFRSMPEHEQTKKMESHTSFVAKRMAEATEKLVKLQKQNREMEMTKVMYQCCTGNLDHQSLTRHDDLNDLLLLVDQKLKEIDLGIGTLSNPNPPATSLPLSLPPPPPAEAGPSSMQVEGLNDPDYEHGDWDDGSDSM